MSDPQYTDSDGEIFPERNLCIYDNFGSEFVNLEIDINFEKWYTPYFTRFSQDVSPFSCELPPLKEVLTSH
jgi:hypothetical protein